MDPQQHKQTKPAVVGDDAALEDTNSNSADSKSAGQDANKFQNTTPNNQANIASLGQAAQVLGQGGSVNQPNQINQQAVPASQPAVVDQSVAPASQAQQQPVNSGQNMGLDDVVVESMNADVGGGQPVPAVGAVQPVQDDQVGGANPAVVGQPPVEPEFPVGGDKERVELRGQMQEIAPVVEMKEDHELEPEVESWMEKLKTGEEIKLPDPVVDDQGDVVLADAGNSVVVEDKVVMPVTSGEYTSGLSKKMTDSARWLSEWVKRLMKQMGDGAVYQSSETGDDGA